MNRLRPPANDGPSRGYATQKLKGQPVSCSYCGDILEGRSKFTALSLDAKSAMCSHCIGKFASMARLVSIKDAYGDPSKENEILSMSRHALRAEALPVSAKEAAIGIVDRLVKRSSCLMAGWRDVDPKTNMSLSPLRLAITREVGDALAIAAGAAGLPCVLSTIDDCLAGETWKRLSRRCMNDRLMIGHGLMIVRGGCVSAKYDCSMAFVDAPFVPAGVEAVIPPRLPFETN